MCRFLFIPLLCCTFFTFTAKSQSVVDAVIAIADLEHRVGEAPTDAERLAASDSIATALISVFEEEVVFSRPFPEWNKMGTMKAPDGAFRFFNWNIPLLDGTYLYRLMILLPDGTHHDLKSTGSPDRDSENKIIPAQQWYGALYYQMEIVDHKRDTYYTLMGWDGHNALSSKKILDVLWFNKRGEPVFGKPVFRDGDELKMRRIFEFTKGAGMTLAYLRAKEAIVYDDLVPMPGMAEGNYSSYVPGTIHRGYRLQKGEWIYQEKVDMSRPASEEGKAQFNFPARPDLNRKRSTSNPLIGD